MKHVSISVSQTTASTNRAGSGSPESSAWTWDFVNSRLRGALVVWFRRWHQRDAEDLASEVLVQLVRAVQRLARAARSDVERLAWKIARDVRADRCRRSGRQPLPLGDELPEIDDGGRAEPATAIDRGVLLAVRGQLEARLGPRQRELLAAWLDADLTSLHALAAALGTDRKRVREMLRGIATKVHRLDAYRPSGETRHAG